MNRKSLPELLDLADDGFLEGEDVLMLQQHVDGCSRITVRLVRERCIKLQAPPRLRLRILQSLRHRQ